MSSPRVKVGPRFERHGTYFKAIFSGEASPTEAISMVETVRLVSIEHGFTKLLMDLRQVEETFDAADHARIGAAVANGLGHLKKVASVVRPDRRTGISERAAGSPLRVFTTEEDAIAWLLEE